MATEDELEVALREYGQVLLYIADKARDAHLIPAKGIPAAAVSAEIIRTAAQFVEERVRVITE